MKYTKLKKITQFLLFTFLISWIFFSISKKSLAAPVINSVNGIFADGENITLNGGSFGAKGTTSPIKYESFEWGSVGDQIDIGNDPVEPKWQKAGAGGATINNAKYHSGHKSAHKEITINSNVCGFYDSYIDLVDTDELYVSYWFYWDTSTGTKLTESGAFFKFNRINGDHVPYGGQPNMLAGLTPNYDLPETGYMEFENYSPSLTYPDPENYLNKDRVPNFLIPIHGQWHRLEMWMKLSNPAGVTNGELEYAIDGVNVVWSGRPGDGCPWEGITLGSSTQKINVFSLLFAACRLTETSYPLLWQDDIYIDNTRARIEIGDASTWTTNTHREVQIPASWSSDSIEFTFNQGSFNNGDTAYLYVVDENGEVNVNGYPITIGSESQILRSDVDNSGTTNTTDALLTLRNSLGLSMNGTSWQIGETTGDVDCNEISNSTDALLILRYSLGLEMGETEWCVA